MTKKLLSFLTSLVVISTASAQNGEYFTALKGVSAARELITSLGIADAKLIAINSHVEDEILNSNGVKNKLDRAGHALNWNYLFSYNTDTRLKLISLSKPNGNFSSGERYDIAITDYSTLYTIEHFTLNNIVEIPTGVVDSDNLRNPENRFEDGTPVYYILGWFQNIYHSLKDSIFIWEKSVGYAHLDPKGVGGSYGTAWLQYSTETGEMFSWYATTGIVETTALSTLTLTLSPNPTTGSISIKGTTTSPQMPINVRIIDALGRQQYQELTQASADGTFAFLWDGLAGGESLPTGAYSAVMTVGSVVKSVPFVVVR